MIFQTSDDKERNFLDLVDDENNSLELFYSKDSIWLQYFGHSNLLCTQASRAIVNLAPMGEYCLRFFPNKDFSYPCGNYSIKSRRHILHKCQRFNKYWNLRRDSIGHFISFLIFNSSAFMFSDSST